MGRRGNRKHRIAAGESHGFTLVELLVVMAIISILAALLLPAIEDTLESARAAACTNNMRQVGIAAMDYHDDHAPYVLSARPRATESSVGYQYDTWDRTLVKLNYIPEEQSTLRDDPVYGGTYVNYRDYSRYFSGILRCPKTTPSPGIYWEFGGGYAMLNTYGTAYLQHMRPYSISSVTNPAATLYIAEAYQTDALNGCALPAAYTLDEWQGNTPLSVETNIATSPYINRSQYLSATASSGRRFAHRHRKRTTTLFFDLHIELVETRSLDYTPIGSPECIIDM